MSKRSSTFVILLGLVTGLLALYISLSRPGRMPVMLKTPEGAAECAADLMDALRDGDYETMEARLYGNPELRMEPENLAGRWIYPLYRESFVYEFHGDPQVTDSGIALEAAVTSLDIARMAEMLAEKITPEEAERPERWSEALTQIPEYPQRTCNITLNLVRERDQWWVLPDEPLLKVISGAME